MKPNYFIKAAAFAAILLALGCSTPKPGMWKDQQISSGLRSNVDDVNKKVISDIIAADHTNLEYYMSKEMTNDKTAYPTIDKISNMFKTGQKRVLAEYYRVEGKDVPDSVLVDSGKISAHAILFPSHSDGEQLYEVFYVVKNGSKEWMVTLEYIKLSYGWKLCALDMGKYSQNGLSAPELCDLAMKQYKKGYLIAAVNTTALEDDCMYPSQMWRYQSVIKMRQFYAKLANEANDKFLFPQPVHQLGSEPSIFSVANKEMPDGSYGPAIYYKTKVNIKDPAAIKKEEQEMNKVINAILPGIKSDAKWLAYVAYNENPSAKRSVDNYEIDEKL